MDATAAAALQAFAIATLAVEWKELYQLVHLETIELTSSGLALPTSHVVCISPFSRHYLFKGTLSNLDLVFHEIRSTDRLTSAHSCNDCHRAQVLPQQSLSRLRYPHRGMALSVSLVHAITRSHVESWKRAPHTSILPRDLRQCYAHETTRLEHNVHMSLFSERRTSSDRSRSKEIRVVA